ncbi:MAG TPA: DMT family transporter [Rubrivivax sp.]|nr:DMT family transporter [Rubrivivax sp.]
MVASFATLAVLLLVLCCALWGLGQVAVKLALPQVPPLLQAGLRSLVAAALLLIWCQARGVSIWQADGTGRLFATEFACIFLGLQYTSASRMSVFLYLSPFVVALGMPFIARHERLRAPQMAGLVLAFSGVVWAFAEGFARPAAGPLQWLGDALGIAAAVLWGLTTLTLRGSRLSTAAPEKTLLYQLGLSGLALTAASVFSPEVWPGLATLSGLTWLSLFFQSVIVSFASYLVWFWLMRHYPATRISAFVLLTPVFGLWFGVALLGEPLTPRIVMALLAVCGGIALVNLPAAARRRGD